MLVLPLCRCLVTQWRAQVCSLLLVVAWFIWGLIYSQLYASQRIACPRP